MPVDMNKQIDFIAYIQRMLVEGNFTATYKYALLHALADICIEMPLTADPNSEIEITFDQIVEKLIGLYWKHALPYVGTSNSAKEGALLQQNPKKQASIITALNECHNNNISNLNQLKRSQYWDSLRRDTLRTLKEGPLWRLQILAKTEQCFLYPHNKRQKYITLNPGIAYCFRRFYDLVVHLSRHAWIQKIQSYPANTSLLGSQTQLDDFLFGVSRQALVKARPVIEEIQHGKCFYCQKSLNTQTEVDHFIPFAKYSNDLGHNFVVAHRSCNNSKRDNLGAIIHRDRWYEQNIIENNELIENELNPYFNCDAKRSEAVTSWAYQIAIKNNVQLWLDKEHFESISGLQKGMIL